MSASAAFDYPCPNCGKVTKFTMSTANGRPTDIYMNVATEAPRPERGTEVSEKSLGDYFADWEGHAFGFGYGTGEEFILPKLRRFFELTKGGTYGTSYDSRELERELEPATAWLIINALCRYGVDVIEYGTSPRCGWLTEEGKRLRDFVLSKTDQELYDLAAGRSELSTVCSPDACNCGPNGYVKGRVCRNPFWRSRK